MEDKQKELLWDQLVARVGTEGATAVFDVVGLGKKADMKPLEGRYWLALVDGEAALPDCPFLREAKALETRFREEADQGSVQETHAVYDRLKMAECRCDGWAHACADVVGAGFHKVIAPAK